MTKSWIIKESKQWSFITDRTSVSEQLLNLPSKNPLISYITFTIITDNTGNRLLRGIVLTHERCDVDQLRNSIGPMFIFSATRCVENLYYTFAEIQINQELHESGDPSPFNPLRKRIIKLKEAIKATYDASADSTDLLNILTSIQL